jgi:hypothetical protein
MFAVPAKLPILYDPERRIVLYYEGCCAYQMTVLAEVTGPPPTKLIPSTPLGAMRTTRGIGLGATPAAVRQRYGPARLHRSTTAPALRVLSYYCDRHVPGASCGWFENFVFRAGRLTEIQAGYAC